MAFVLSLRFERVARLLLVLLLAEGLPLRAVTETGLGLSSVPGAGNGLPGELPPAMPETRMDGVGLTRVGDEAFEFDSPAAAVPIPARRVRAGSVGLDDLDQELGSGSPDRREPLRAGRTGALRSSTTTTLVG